MHHYEAIVTFLSTCNLTHCSMCKVMTLKSFLKYQVFLAAGKLKITLVNSKILSLRIAQNHNQKENQLQPAICMSLVYITYGSRL